MRRVAEWFIGFIATAVTVVGLRYIADGTPPEAGAGTAAIIGIPVATMLVGVDWALSAETIRRRLGRLVVAVVVTLLIAVLPIAFFGVFLILTTNAA